MVTFLAALAALVGTLLQVNEGFSQLAQLEDEREVFRTVDGMRLEHPRSHPIKRWKQRRTVRQMLRESPVEAAMYHRVWRIVWSWALLGGAAGLTAGDALVNTLQG